MTLMDSFAVNNRVLEPAGITKNVVSFVHLCGGV